MPIPPWLITWLLNPKVWLAAIATGAIIGAGLYVHNLQVQRDQAVAAAAVAHGVAVVASGQAVATQSAAVIAAAGVQHDTVDINVHQENARAIQAAPGASAPVDPALNAIGVRGLCQYADLYGSDPQCSELRSGDPAQLSPAGSGDATP